AGDEVVITGRNLGNEIGTLLFGGRELPTANVTLWRDEQISFTVPRTADSGLLYVINERGRSDGVLLQVRESMPVAGSGIERPGAPIVDAVSEETLRVGTTVTIRGSNFGRLRRSSRVVFPMAGAVSCASCAEALSYAFWSDSEIVVRVPSGVTSGLVSVVTAWGASNPVRILVERPSGGLAAENPAEIALRYGARLTDVILDSPEEPVLPGERDIVIRLPVLSTTHAQRSLRYLSDRTHQSRFELVDASFDHEITRTLIVERFAIRSEINPAAISAAYEAETGFFEHYTRALPDLPVDEPGIQEVAGRLRANRASPYRIAEAAYAFTLDSLVYAIGMPDRSVISGLEAGAGDDFTYALVFVTALRAARVPARPVGGILVTEDGDAYPHFWAEFFVTGIGWIPVDPALGDGAFPAGFPVPEDPRTFYFANLDNRRLAFSHGYDSREPTFLDGVSRTPDDPYTLQRSFADAGARIASFELDWHAPRVIGLFLSD
ncbi:MAG TPA: transglutaminase domain-containing protein, partial [Spirochaetia bacterium]|nr:transglutaminase domain-containing protein [Spirochaetia bacterium]